MSNIYILEPPTLGKVLLKTTVGDIEIELWAKETPKACRNFIQLCLEGYYNNLIFHRVVKGFIVQGGDPNGDGTGGESIYGEPFKDEFHQRLKFSRRGIVAMANAGKDDNGSQFFFTLGPTPELQNKHTIFGKIVGDTVFNMLKLQEGVIEDERPEFPNKILKTDVLNNPFPDIISREVKRETHVSKKSKEKKSGVKNFKLLSFGEEAEEEEEEITKINEKYGGKGKSTHDVLDDPHLSSSISESIEKSQPEEVDLGEQLENIRKKLKTDHKKPLELTKYTSKAEEQDKQKMKMLKIQEEIKSVKREYQSNKLKGIKETEEKTVKEREKNETFNEYKLEYDAYKNRKNELPKKGAGREQFTLQLLTKFKEKLNSAKQNEVNTNESDKGEENVDDESWLSHQLKFENDAAVLAKDANKKDDDWYEVYDPRNPLNKRRRGENIKKFK